MSRIGKLPIQIPDGTEVKIEGQKISVKNKKGELSLTAHRKMKISLNDKTLIVERKGEDKLSKALHGLTRTLINNMIIGLNEGFVKQLEIQGVGYRAQVQGKKLILSLGYSHPVEYPFPEGINIEIDKENKNILIISGYDKEKVGQTASEIRGYKKPEPYKGKGIRYVGEHIVKKAGKAAGAAGAEK